MNLKASPFHSSSKPRDPGQVCHFPASVALTDQVMRTAQPSTSGRLLSAALHIWEVPSAMSAMPTMQGRLLHQYWVPAHARMHLCLRATPWPVQAQSKQPRSPPLFPLSCSVPPKSGQSWPGSASTTCLLSPHRERPPISPFPSLPVLPSHLHSHSHSPLSRPGSLPTLTSSPLGNLHPDWDYIAPTFYLKQPVGSASR